MPDRIDDDVLVRAFAEHKIGKGSVVIRRIVGSLMRVPICGCCDTTSMRSECRLAYYQSKEAALRDLFQDLNPDVSKSLTRSATARSGTR